MSARRTLEQELATWSGSTLARGQVAETVLALAHAAVRLSTLAAEGELAGGLGRATGKSSATDEQKMLDVIASDAIAEALKDSPVSLFLTEELDVPVTLQNGAPLIVAADPIDGSSNIEANASIGTIFSILPAMPGRSGASAFLQPGRNQLAAGFFVYGPQTTLAFTAGDGTQLYTLDRDSGQFVLTNPHAEIPPSAREFAVNASNYRHWDEPMKVWLDECLQGAEGPREQDYNMRWTASPVAEFYRILIRGGVFLYPGDRRRGYTQGRLRLVYEANPFAFVIEQAGGAATDGIVRTLDLEPTGHHQHVPFVAGARDEVSHIARLNQSPLTSGLRSPLFLRRGLMRA
jgi:fructose-1,6-bisphosphatase I